MYSCSSCALLTRPPIFEVEIEMHDDLSPMLVVSQAHDPFSVRVKMCTFSPLIVVSNTRTPSTVGGSSPLVKMPYITPSLD